MSLSKRYTTVTPLSKLLALALFILLPFLGFFLGMSYQKGLEVKRFDNSVSQNGGMSGRKACTMEAKLCPDGSFVARSGPNCEFAKCPGDK